LPLANRSSLSQGLVAATKVGALPKSKIKEWIESPI